MGLENKKLRAWFQVDGRDMFYIPVETEEEAQMIIDSLAAYHNFLFNNKKIKTMNYEFGLDIWNDKLHMWDHWAEMINGKKYNYFQDYCLGESEQADKLIKFRSAISRQNTIYDRYLV